MAKINITVYASSTGLFAEEECDTENLTEIAVDELLLKRWVDENIYRFKSYAEFLDTYTADDTDRLVGWLIDNGYGLEVEGRPGYKYGMRLRPCGPGCQPMGFAWREDDREGKYYDILVYPTPLSKEQVEHFSLDPLYVGDFIAPITAKAYCVEHFADYPFGMKDKEEMIALLNILQASGETLDTMHDTVFNGRIEFMDIIGRWDTDKDLYDSVLQFNTFFAEREFVDWMLEKIEELKYDGSDPAEEIRSWTYNDEPSDTIIITDTKIIKTEDGYVVRVWY